MGCRRGDWCEAAPARCPLAWLPAAAGRTRRLVPRPVRRCASRQPAANADNMTTHVCFTLGRCVSGIPTPGSAPPRLRRCPPCRPPAPLCPRPRPREPALPPNSPLLGAPCILTWPSPCHPLTPVSPPGPRTLPILPQAAAAPPAALTSPPLPTPSRHVWPRPLRAVSLLATASLPRLRLWSCNLVSLGPRSSSLLPRNPCFLPPQVSYYYDPDVGDFHYGSGHPMKASGPAALPAQPTALPAWSLQLARATAHAPTQPPPHTTPPRHALPLGCCTPRQGIACCCCRRPLQPHRVRLTHCLVSRYDLWRHMDVRGGDRKGG
jgi:hypothetical protein